ncbi:MAG TPA: nucleoside deaminase [Saprospiraceae bacterium]|nr:nucleoside deaminase [Saprospiraceae bacterium]HNT19820.1 nucleoside deaminase [Saprospiraceae bacterium]
MGIGAENQDFNFLTQAIQEALAGVRRKEGGPFGAVIVKDGLIIAAGNNQVLLTMDPTAHAEVVAIRRACQVLGNYQLHDCIIYSSCEPCPMCLGAIYWSRPKKIIYSATRLDAAGAGFDDSYIYDQFALENQDRKIETLCLPVPERMDPFNWWEKWGDKSFY